MPKPISKPFKLVLHDSTSPCILRQDLLLQQTPFTKYIMLTHPTKHKIKVITVSNINTTIKSDLMLQQGILQIFKYINHSMGYDLIVVLILLTVMTQILCLVGCVSMIYLVNAVCYKKRSNLRIPGEVESCKTILSCLEISFGISRTKYFLRGEM